MRPLLDWVVLTDETGVEKKGKAGIIMPAHDRQIDSSYLGTVVAMGPGLHSAHGALMPMPEMKVGDTVRYVCHSVFQIEQNGEKLVMMRAHQIMGVESE